MAESNTDFVATGIEGLDEVLKGGIPTRNQVLIAGAPGTGKTLMALKILCNSVKDGKRAAFISFDEKTENVIKNASKSFPKIGDVEEFIRKGILTIDGDDSATKIATNTEHESGYSLGNMVSEVEGIIKSINAEVAVIDSLSFLKLMIGKGIAYNKSVSALVTNFRRLKVTGIFTLDVPYYERERMKYVQEILLFDGLIALYHTHTDGDEELGMEVVKMRGTAHKRMLSKYVIGSSGIAFK